VTVQGYSPQQMNGVSITLGETARRGLFRGVIPLVSANPSPSRSELFVRAGDTFRVDYFDASANRTLETSATIETTPPLISQVSFEAGYVDALITWDTSEPTDALVQYSESPGNLPINFTAYDSSYDVSHALVLDQLKPSNTYYFRVVSRDR